MSISYPRYHYANARLRSDSAPVNSYPRNTTSTSFSSQWVFDVQSSGWAVIIPSSYHSTTIIDNYLSKAMDW
jgi:hypothetical protein